MSLESEHELSPITVAAARDYLFASPVSEVELSDEALVSFALGLMPPAEEESALEVLTTSHESRIRLIEVNGRIEEYARTPILPLPESDSESALVRLLREQTRQSINHFAHLRDWCLVTGWERITQVQTREALIARAAFLCIAQTLRQSWRDTRFSATRGSETSPQFVGHFPPGVSIRLFVEVDAVGDLKCSAAFEDQTSGASLPLIGRSMSLELIDPSGGGLPIGVAEISEGGWSLEIKGFTSFTGIGSDLAMPGIFRLSLTSAPSDERATSHLYVQVQGTDEFELIGIAEPPRFENGELVVTLVADQSLRVSYAEYRFELLIPIGRILQVIGSWSMSSWIEDAHTYRVSFPGMLDGAMDCGSILRARLVIP